MPAEREPGEEESIVDKEQQRADYQRLCTTLKGYRDKAIDGRRTSGIEADWLGDEEYYEGIDDSNRGEKLIKPTSPDGTIRIAKKSAVSATRSTVFVELTRPYVDAAAARVSDMLLPTDDRNWSIIPTPVPDLIKQLENTSPVTGQDGQPVMVQGDMVEQNGQTVQMARPMTVADQAQKAISDAKAACEKAQAQIDDWLTECDYLDECRSVIDDAARIGVGILKGPIPKRMRKKAVIKALQFVGIEIKESLNPVSVRVSAWNFYPDPDCGDDIQRGKYVFERDDITGRELSELKGTAGYIDEAIDEVLEEGPKDSIIKGSPKKEGDRRIDSELYQIWYFHGYLSANELDTLGARDCGCEGNQQYPVICTMVNDRIIKAAVSPLDSGEFPYDVFVWQKRSGHWAGRGVARQMRTDQDGVNAAVRNLMDNAGLSGGPMWAVNRSKLIPIDGKWELRARKGFYTRNDEDVQNIRDALTFFNVPSMQVELLNITEFWKRSAEDATGLPMLLQGQLGQSPDTVGGMTMLNNNATTVLRRIAKTYDSRITDRHLSRYYEWLLIHGEDDSAKGDFTIKARGSSALIERDAQSQFLMQMLTASLNPRFKLDPAKIMAKVLKSQRFDAEDVEMSDEEYEATQQAQPDPRLAVAQMKEEGVNQRFAAELQAKQQADAMEYAFRQWEKQIDATLQAAELDGEKDLLREELKTRIFDTTAKLKTQWQLSMASMAQANDHETAKHLVDLQKGAASPATEPVLRAPDGQSFQR